MIDSLDNKKIKEIASLKIKKYRDQYGLFLIEGKHLVDEAKKSGLLEEVILFDDNYDFDKKLIVSEKVMKKLSFQDSLPSIMGVCKIKDSKLIGSKYLLLDGIQDPGNLGTIIRSGLAFGVDTIVLSKDSVDLYNDKVIRSTQGMIFHINIIRCDLEDVINKIKGDIKIIGTSLGDSTPLRSIDKLERYALIVGNEGNGVKKEILDLCDDIVRIEMNKDVESLNVGVATSIILYEMSDNYE